MIKTKTLGLSLGLLLGTLTLGSLQTAEAAALRLNSGFNNSVLGGNDDGSTGSESTGMSLNFFGATYTNVFVNNNGNVTFTAPLGVFTPFSLLTTNTAIIAPFFADVDTRPAGSRDVTFGTDTVDGHAAFGVNWIDVGYYSNQTNPTNSFQLVIIDRSDIAPGDFDFEFNYDRILWETGQASGGNTSGLGGASARAGWSNGIAATYEIDGSAINGALLDGGPNALIHDRLNSNVDGRYVFQVRNGVVQSVPEAGASLGLLGLALSGLFLVRKKLM